MSDVFLHARKLLIGILPPHRLYWIYLFRPYLPDLAHLHRLLPKANEHGDPASFLFAVLCLLALDAQNSNAAAITCDSSLPLYLRSAIAHHGETVLLGLPRHCYAAAALELLYAFYPTALAASTTSAAASLCSETLLLAAERILASEHVASLVQEGSPPEAINFTLQKLRLEVASHGLPRHRQLRLSWTARGNWEWESSLARVSSLGALLDLERHCGSLLLAHSAAALKEQGNTLHLLYSKRGDLDQMDTVVRLHTESDARLLQQLHVALSSFGDCFAAEAVSNVAILEGHVRHNNVSGYAMFLATLSGAGANQESAVSKHIVDRLKSQPSGPISSFLQRHGDRRTDDLAKILTGFCGLSSLESPRGATVLFQPPSAISLCAEIVYACKNIVEVNAAKLTGWSGLDDRLDLHLVAFTESASRLKCMCSGLATASAGLVRSLHTILVNWRRQVNRRERQQQTVVLPSSSSPHPARRQSLNTLSSSTGSATAESDLSYVSPAGTNGSSSSPLDEFLVDWSSWPQLDQLTDWSVSFGADWSVPFAGAEAEGG